MSIVFNISKESCDADTLDPNRLVATSLKTQLKIIYERQGTITIANGQNSSPSLVVRHGLDYAPLVFGYSEHPDVIGKWWLGDTGLGETGQTRYGVSFSVDEQNITITGYIADIGQTSVGNTVLKWKLFILDQPYGEFTGPGDKPVGWVDQKQGLIVSREGVNADVAKLHEQQFNSNTDHLKYHKTLSKNVSVSVGSTEVKFTHNLGYVPLFRMYVKQISTGFYFELPLGFVPNNLITSAGATKTDVTVNVVSASPTGTSLARVVIFKNRLVV